MSGQKTFLLFVAAGLLACFVLWRIPANRYQWMRDDLTVGTPSTPLPADPDARASLAVFAIPAVLVALLNAAHSRWRLSGTLRAAGYAFSAAILIFVCARLAAA